MLQIEKNVSLKNFTTFKLDARVAFFSHINSLSDLKDAFSFAKENAVACMPLGGGSNIICEDEKILELYVLKIDILGFEIVSENDTELLLKIGAGVPWDESVAYAVSHGYSGIEAMSFIPGSTGATPVQNVGAYGVEIKDVLTSLSAYNTETGIVEIFTHDMCMFDYRNSIFKSELGKKYIIVDITLKLFKTNQVLIPQYAGVSSYFETEGIIEPTLLDVRNAIIQIRSSKLPDPEVLASCGSFFKNPIVPNNRALELQSKYPKAVVHAVSDELSKIGAGWLIDSLGLKGNDFGAIKIYEHNALVLVNKGQATKKELFEVVDFIQKKVFDTYGIVIEMEPILVS